jgi:hypothetical protein
MEIEKSEAGQEAGRVLRAAGMGNTSLWVWFTSSSSWLDGEIPAEVLKSDPARVIAAARRFVSNSQDN